MSVPISGAKDDRLDDIVHEDRIKFHAAIYKLPVRQIAEWIMQKTETLDSYIYEIVVKRLSKTANEFDSQNKDILRKCIQKCFRDVFIQYSGNTDLKILKTLLKVQRELDVSAYQQFLWLCSLPKAVKKKWTLISTTIPALQCDEIYVNTFVNRLIEYTCNDIENILMASLWEASACQSNGCPTSDCVLAWSISDKSDSETFAHFIADCLTSSNRIRRQNCSRFWLTKLNSGIDSKFIMKKAAAVILQMISDEKQYAKQTNCSYEITKCELRQLSYVDHFYDSNPEKLDDDIIWLRFDRLLYAWISIQKFFICSLDKNESDLLQKCLTSYHSILRLEAFNLTNKLMKKKMLSLPHQFGSSFKFFVLQNLNTNDNNLRGIICNHIRTLSDKARKRLEKALVQELDDIWYNKRESREISFIFDLLKQCGFDGWFDQSQEMYTLIDHDNAEIRWGTYATIIYSNSTYELVSDKKSKFITCLSSLQRSSQIFLVEKFIEMLSNSTTIGLSEFVVLLLQFKQPREIFDLLEISKTSDLNVMKIILISLLQNSTCELSFDLSSFVNICIESNTDFLLLSGSEHIRQCTSLPELYKRLYPSIEYCPTLMISKEQRNAVDQYSQMLKAISTGISKGLQNNVYLKLSCTQVNCELLACISERIGLQNIIMNAYDSVWNVLMRSRHKGVIDDCAIYFSRITNCCIKNNMFNLVHQYFSKTRELFLDKNCVTRNLAFCSIFKIFHEIIPTSVTDFLFGDAAVHMTWVAVRQMKVLKTLLCMTCFDVTSFARTIFKSTLESYRHGEYVVRSTASHCFAAFVHKLVDDVENGMPLYMFLSLYKSLWEEYIQQFEQTTVHDPALIFLLSLLHTLHFVSVSFYSENQLKNLKKIVRKLVSLLVANSDFRINRLIVSSLLNLVPYSHKLLARIKFRIFMRKMWSNAQFCQELSPKTALLPVFMQKISNFLLERQFYCSDQTEALLVEIEKYAYSSKELKRLHAAHALVLINSTFTYFRFIACCRKLLLDEVECITRVMSRLAIPFSSTSVSDDLLSYSWNPSIKLKVITY
ncbi:unnamed protein product [Thelazia callipaeda]|uniref:DUF2428 domain-containing protein n=1 Tax=Thelazia callipaeda TaxID=103827 RepID=A0A0N5CJL9_THECL|nr:unnamed protein product [Thelazia callipaeda]